MEMKLFGELKIYVFVIPISIHADRPPHMAKRVAMQTIPCYYEARKETLARFLEANRDLITSRSQIWAEFRFTETLTL